MTSKLRRGCIADRTAQNAIPGPTVPCIPVLKHSGGGAETCGRMSTILHCVPLVRKSCLYVPAAWSYSVGGWGWVICELTLRLSVSMEMVCVWAQSDTRVYRATLDLTLLYVAKIGLGEGTCALACSPIGVSSCPQQCNQPQNGLWRRYEKCRPRNPLNWSGSPTCRS